MDINANLPAANTRPLNYPFTPPSLKYLATTSLALSLWNRNNHLLTRLYMPHTITPEIEFSCVDILQTSLPSCLKEIIDKRIRSMRLELKILLEGFIALSISTRNFFLCFDSFTYGPDGRICHERSARNLLASDNITPLQKYRIACVYWFEEDVRRIWPLVSEDPQINVTVPRFLEIILQYWRNKMTNVDINRSDFVELLANMDSFRKWRNWTAFESMLNILNVDQQHRFFTRLNTFGPELKYVLSKLNIEQGSHVLRMYPVEIIRMLASDEQCFDYVLRIWNDVQGSMNFALFSTLVKNLCNRAYVCERQRPEAHRDTYIRIEVTNIRHRTSVCREKENCLEKSPRVVAILLEIWNTAPNGYKNRFLYDDGVIENLFFKLNTGDVIIHLVDLMETIRSNVKICYDHDVSFYYRLFYEMSPEMRVRVWRNHWPELVIRSQCWFLNKLLKLCLEDDGVIKRFVEKEMFNFTRIRSIINSWLNQKLYSGMMDYSNLCSWNDNLVWEFRRKFFMAVIASMKNNIDEESLIKLAESIDLTISNVDEARETKKFVFFLEDFQKHIIDRIGSGITNNVFRLTECFLHTKRSQRERDLFLPHWSSFLTSKPNEVIEVERWQEFLSWWESTDNWPVFKVTLPVDEIFEKLLLDVVRSLTLWLGPMDMKRSEPMPLSNSELKEFAPVDQFLMYYFDNEESVKNYKWNKILNYHETTGLINLFSINNECIVNDVLRWFFNGDLIGISTFKDRLPINL